MEGLLVEEDPVSLFYGEDSAARGCGQGPLGDGHKLQLFVPVPGDGQLVEIVTVAGGGKGRRSVAGKLFSLFVCQGSAGGYAHVGSFLTVLS